MSIMVRYAPKSMTAEQYDAIVKKEYELGIHPVSYTHLTLPTISSV